MTIRPAVLAEVDDLAALATRTFPLACPPSMPQSDIDAFMAEHLSVEVFAAAVNDTDHRVCVAEESGELLGYTLMTAELRHVYLSKLYVTPELHGTGVAVALIEDAVGWARGRGAQVLRLGVNQENLRAKAFYLKNGFAVVGERQFPVGERIENDFMLERVIQA